MGFMDIMKNVGNKIAGGAKAAAHGAEWVYDKSQAKKIVDSATSPPPDETNIDQYSLTPEDLKKYGGESPYSPDNFLPPVAAGPDQAQQEEIHNAYKELWKMHLDNLQKQGQPYIQALNQMQEDMRNNPAKPKFSPLSAFAIALGSQQGAANVKAHNESVDAEQQKREDRLNAMRQKAIEGHMQQLIDTGKFKEALMTSALGKDIAATAARKKGEAELALQKLKNIGLAERAQEAGRTALAAAKAKLSSEFSGKLLEKAVEFAGQAALARINRKSGVFQDPELGEDEINGVVQDALRQMQTIGTGNLTETGTGTTDTTNTPGTTGTRRSISQGGNAPSTTWTRPR